jgi:hypothetical protein
MFRTPPLASCAIRAGLSHFSEIPLPSSVALVRVPAVNDSLTVSLHWIAFHIATCGGTRLHNGNSLAIRLMHECENRPKTNDSVNGGDAAILYAMIHGLI